jgi:outer membrane immunogenic protein
MMKRIILAALAGVAGTTPAMANSFNGFFIGAGINYDSYEVQAQDVFNAGDKFDGLSGNGVGGSIFAGYDLPLAHNIFAGVEGGVDLSDASTSASDGVDTVKVSAEETWRLSARLGAMVNSNTGVYARLGWAHTRFKTAIDGVKVDSTHESAFVYGAGLETRVAKNTSIRVEYLREEYGSGDLGAGTDVSNGKVQLGVAYRF